jgi:hypothetical protein
MLHPKILIAKPIPTYQLKLVCTSGKTKLFAPSPTQPGHYTKNHCMLYCYLSVNPIAILKKEYHSSGCLGHGKPG